MNTTNFFRLYPQTAQQLRQLVLLHGPETIRQAITEIEKQDAAKLKGRQATVDRLLTVAIPNQTL